MPFDNTPWQVPGKDRHADLKFLAHLLRNPSLWPPGFKWNFFNCDTCAIGLGEKFGLPTRSATSLGLNYSDYQTIFLQDDAGQNRFEGFFGFMTQPRHVAKAIDKVLKKYEA